MKLLLTSGGLTNPTLKNTFIDLLVQSPMETTVAVIPTASQNMKSKDWYKRDVATLRDIGIVQIQEVDITASPIDQWMPELESADVIYVPGGDVYHLRDQVVASGLADELPHLLSQKVYVGISAGSRLLNPDISVAALLYSPEKDPRGLSITDFCIIPHMNSESFTDRTSEQIAPQLVDFPYTTYLIDDDCAVLIQGSMMQIVGGGEYVEYKK